MTAAKSKLVDADARRDVVLEYLSKCRDLMYLQAYELTLKRDEPNDKNAIAVVETTEGRFIATIWLGLGFWDQPPEDQRQTIAHEFVHVIQRDMTDVIRMGAWIRHVGQSGYDATWEAFRDQVEKQADRLATIIAPTLPLPDFPKLGDERPAGDPMPIHGARIIDNLPASSLTSQ